MKTIIYLLFTFALVGQAMAQNSCHPVREGIREIDQYLMAQKVERIEDNDQTELTYSMLLSDYDKVAAELTILRALKALKNTYALKMDELFKLSLEGQENPQGKDPLAALETNIDQVLDVGQRMVGISQLVSHFQKTGQELNEKNFKEFITKNCKSPNQNIQGLSITCQALRSTQKPGANEGFSALNMDSLASYFQRFVDLNSVVFQGVDSNDKEKIDEIYSSYQNILFPGTKQTLELKDAPEKYGFKAEVDQQDAFLKRSKAVKAALSKYLDCVKSKRSDCARNDRPLPDLLTAYHKDVQAYTNVKSTEENKAYDLSASSNVIMAKVEQQVGEIDKFAKILRNGTGLAQVESAPVMNDLYRSLYLAFRRNGSDSPRPQTNFKEAFPEILDSVHNVLSKGKGQHICINFLNGLAAADFENLSTAPTQDNIGRCLQNLEGEVLGKVSDRIALLENQLTKLQGEIDGIKILPENSDLLKIKNELAAYLLSQCSDSYKQETYSCNISGLDSPFSGISFLETNVAGVLIELDRSLGSNQYALNTLKAKCNRADEIKLSIVRGLCHTIDANQIAYEGIAPSPITAGDYAGGQVGPGPGQGGGNLVSPGGDFTGSPSNYPDLDYKIRKEDPARTRDRMRASNAKSFREYLKTNHYDKKHGVLAHDDRRDTGLDHVAKAFQRPRIKQLTAELTGEFFWGLDGGRDDLMIQQAFMANQNRLNYQQYWTSYYQQMQANQAAYQQHMYQQYLDTSFNGATYGYSPNNNLNAQFGPGGYQDTPISIGGIPI